MAPTPMPQRSEMTKRLPNLFVPGAMKAGTTSLAAALDQHPQIALHPFKEPMYFAQTPASREKLYELLSPDGESYDRVTPHNSISYVDLETYLSGFAGAQDARYRLDASTMYLQSPDAIALARAASPDARFIAVLRDPYARAYSAYQYQRSRMREPAATFAEAIAHERSGARDTWMYGWRYVFSSLYFEQVARLFAEVPEAERLVVFFEDLVGAGGLDPVFRFLGLPSHDIGMVFENETVLLEGTAARAAARLTHNQRLGRVVRGVLPASAVASVRSAVAVARKFVYRSGTRPAPMTSADRALMSDLVEPDLDRLERLLDRDLSAWRFHARNRVTS